MEVLKEKEKESKAKENETKQKHTQECVKRMQKPTLRKLPMAKTGMI